jgi:hypothetical protein
MSEMAMPYRFRLLHRKGISSECRACRNQISSGQLRHTIIVRWMQEFNQLDFCQKCYNKYIQQYFKAQDFITSAEQPGFFEALSKLDA